MEDLEGAEIKEKLAVLRAGQCPRFLSRSLSPFTTPYVAENPRCSSLVLPTNVQGCRRGLGSLRGTWEGGAWLMARAGPGSAGWW